MVTRLHTVQVGSTNSATSKASISSPSKSVCACNFATSNPAHVVFPVSKQAKMDIAGVEGVSCRDVEDDCPKIFQDGTLRSRMAQAQALAHKMLLYEGPCSDVNKTLHRALAFSPYCRPTGSSESSPP